MNVTELYNLARWVDENITKPQIPQKYQKLQKILQQNVQPNQPQQPFESPKADLIKTIKNVPLKLLTKEQLTFLRDIKIAQYIGEEG
jgi:hypothetical protein